MLVPPRPVRRLLLGVAVPAVIAVAVAAAVAGIAGAVLAPVLRRRRLLRAAGFALAYSLTELAVLAALGWQSLRRAVTRTDDERWLVVHNDLLAWALDRILGAGHRCFGFEVAMADGPEPAVLYGTGPVLVLARHGGPGDSFALAHVLLTRYRRRVRIVLKDILQFDPALDILLSRLGCCFLPTRPGAGDVLTDRIGRLAGTLGERDALLLFPEGGNWTPARRERAIRHLETHGEPDLARAAALLDNVLPPRPGGVMASLDNHPGLPVVVVAHTGLDWITEVRQAWAAIPVATPMTVRAWPAAPVPGDDDKRRAWLLTEWATIDEWIDAQRGR